MRSVWFVRHVYKHAGINSQGIITDFHTFVFQSWRPISWGSSSLDQSAMTTDCSVIFILLLHLPGEYTVVICRFPVFCSVWEHLRVCVLFPNTTNLSLAESCTRMKEVCFLSLWKTPYVVFRNPLLNCFVTFPCGGHQIQVFVLKNEETSWDFRSERTGIERERKLFPAFCVTFHWDMSVVT